jgi:K(+)-stimulated pyrophosphate-energized sodium pump
MNLEKYDLNVSNPRNLFGLLIGASVVFLFSGLAINAVSRAAGAVIYEVRRQFRDHPGIMEGTELPEYGKVVDIVTRDSLRELVTPGLLAVLTPIAVGFGLGIGALASFLAGTIATGTLMAVFLSNSGGAWDNAKKFVEDGNFGGKGSEAHTATVVGDTVGDPFKDTAGPAINPLLKVMNLVALLIAPAVVSMDLHGQTRNQLGLAFGAIAIVVIAVIISKRRPIAVGEEVFAEVAN